MDRGAPPTGTAHGSGAQPLRAGDPERLGRHAILGRLGSGGMGVVYLGDGPLGLVAVKVVRADLADDPEFRVRFQREVQSSFRLSSGHGRGARATARLVDFDLTAEQPWFATEFLDAQDLGTLVANAGPLDVDAQLALARGLADGLVALHEAELVHRDLKPTNVLMTADGPKLIDFGISSVVGAARLTTTGQLLGTPAWMAPEQISSGSTTPASDVFAWASVVAFAASGRPPFGNGSPSSVAVRVLHGEPDIDDERLAPALQPLVRRAFARDPADRPDVHALQAALPADVAAGALPAQRPAAADAEETKASAEARPTARQPAAEPHGWGPPPSAPTQIHQDAPHRPRRSRRPLIAVLVVLLVLALAGGGVLLATRSGDESAGGGPDGGGPRDVALARETLFFTDGSAIRRSSPGQNGTLIDVGAGGGQPSALDGGPDGLFYVDTAGPSVRSVTFAGRSTGVDVPLADGPLGSRHVVDASAKYFYVLDGGRLTRFDLDGGDPQVVAGGGTGGDGDALGADLSRAVGVEAFGDDDTEEVYVLEPGALRRISDGRITTDRRFEVPTDGTSGFVLDPNTGVLTLPEAGAGRVVDVDRQGRATVVAGEGGPGPAESPARRTALGDILGVNYAPGGFYLVERPQDGANRVLRVDRTAGTISPVSTD